MNVIEAHPTLPLIAVSGIDHEPKVIPPLARPSSLRLTLCFSYLALTKEEMSGRGSTGQRISSIATWVALTSHRYSHSSRTLGLSSMNQVQWILLNVHTSKEGRNEFLLYHYCCIISTNLCVLNTLPACDRDCQFLTCHTDLDNQRWPPSANHKHFLSTQPVSFDEGRYLLGYLNGIWEVGGLRKEERGIRPTTAPDRDNTQRLPTIRDGGLTGTHRHCTDPVSTLSFEVGDETGIGLPSSLPAVQLHRIIFRVSPLSQSVSSRTRPVCAIHSADSLFIHFFLLPRFNSQSEVSVRRVA